MSRNPNLPTSRSEAHRVLRIAPGASSQQVKEAFRRLALQYHPDRNRNVAGGLPERACAERFREVVQAYRVLGGREADGSTRTGSKPCAGCGRIGRLRYGLDGNAYCRPCLLSGRVGRALPGPPAVIVGGGISAGLLLVSALLLVTWSATGHSACWCAAMGLCLTSLAVLFAVCVRVGYAATRRELALARGQSAARGRTSGSR